MSNEAIQFIYKKRRGRACAAPSDTDLRISSILLSRRNGITCSPIEAVSQFDSIDPLDLHVDDPVVIGFFDRQFKTITFFCAGSSACKKKSERSKTARVHFEQHGQISIAAK